MKFLVFIAVFIGAIYWITLPRTYEFDAKTIDSIRSNIRSEYEKRDGIDVMEVSMMRESPRKATGFVKLKMKDLGNKTAFTRPCSATMSDDTGKTMWECQ